MRGLAPTRGRGGRNGLTLIELAVVVVIVAILAMVVLGLARENITIAKMSEGIAGCGTIRTALELYATQHNGKYPLLFHVKGNELDELNIAPSDLDGKYFQADDYTVVSMELAYTVIATLDETGDTFTLNHEGGSSSTLHIGDN